MSIKKILMERDGMTSEEATDLIREAVSTLSDYLADGDTESAYDICSEFFGLEPDYLMELI